MRVASWTRFFLGLVCGPLIALYLIPLSNCALVLIGDVSDCWIGISGFTWYGLPIVIIAVMVAFPLFLFFLRVGWVGLGQCVCAGILIAAAISGALSLFDPGLSFVALILGFSLMGSVAALLFWLIAIRHNTT